MSASLPDLRLTRFSPSTVSALAACPFRVALLRADPSLRRPRLTASVGSIAHEVTERAWRGSFDGLSADELPAALEAAWAAATAAEAARVAASVAPAEPPPPDRWPGFALTRARLLRRLRRLLESSRERPPGPADGWVSAEYDLADARSGLFGRLDRLERTGGRLRVVDLKSGIGQREMQPEQRRQLLLYAVLVHRALGEWPAEVAVETAGGGEIGVEVDAREAEGALEGAQALVHAYNAAVDRGHPSAMAAPSAEHCLHCLARVACEPYWEALEVSWPYQGAARGRVVRTSETAGRSTVELLASSPRELGGAAVELYGLLALPVVRSSGLRVVGAQATNGGTKLKATWDTVVRADDVGPGEAIGKP